MKIFYLVSSALTFGLGYLAASCRTGDAVPSVRDSALTALYMFALLSGIEAAARFVPWAIACVKQWRAKHKGRGGS